MKGIFSVDGKFYTVTSKILDMVIITFLWIIGCIPVVTILTSTSSLYHTTVKCIRYDRGKVFEEFKEAYKKNLRQGVELTLFFGGIGAAAGYTDYCMVVRAGSKTGGSPVFMIVMLMLTAVYLLNLLWMVPVFSRFANTFGRILQLNFVMSLRYMIRSIPMLLIIAMGIFFIYISLPLVILMPSLTMLLISCFSEPGMRKFMPGQEEDNGDWRYGFK